MRIDKIAIQNFHGFEEKTVELHPFLTVLIGANATGKSAILDALAIAAGSYFLGVDGINSLTITDRHIRQSSRAQADGAQTKMFHTPSKVSAWGEVHGRPLQWSRERRAKAGGQTTRKDAAALAELATHAVKAVGIGMEAVLPFIGAYSAARLGREKRETSKAKQKLVERSPLNGYLHALATESTSWMAEQWLKGLEQRMLRRQGAAADIWAELRNRILALFQGIERPLDDFWTDFEEEEIYFRYQDATNSVKASFMSSGYKSIFALGLDIAHRMATLNSHLGPNVFDETPGIVLIDEVDMHLHPTWQRVVLANLRASFPKLQIVASTHSPYVVQSVADAKIIDLDEEREIPVPTRIDKSIEEVAEDLMGVSDQSRSQQYQDMVRTAETYFGLLQKGHPQTDTEVAELRAKLDELELKYGKDPAYVALMRVERKASGVDSA